MRHFIISPDRCLIHTQSPLIEGWEVCTDLKTLMAFTKNSPSKQQEDIKWVGPKIPATIWEQVFGTMAKFPNMEIHLNLYHKITTGEWAIKCPKQRGTGASVSSEDNLDGMPKGFHMVGTIHSHPNMSAFWSGTDMNDQQRKYGLHFVFGLTKGLPTSYKCSIFTPRSHFDQDWDTVCEAIDFKKEYQPNNEWVEIIKKQELKPQYPSYSWRPPQSQHSGYPAQYSFGGDDWGDAPYDGWSEPVYRNQRQTRDDRPAKSPKLESPVTWASVAKARQSERSMVTQEAVNVFGDILRTVMEYMIENDGIAALEEVLSDYDLTVIDRHSQERDYAAEADMLFEDFEENGFPDLDKFNEVLEQHGYKVTPEKQEEQYYFSDQALDAFEEQQAIKEINKC